MSVLNVENVEKPARKFEKTILDHFTNVNNENEKIRIKSSVNLLKYLSKNENAENENEVKYALGRIIRGLGSPSISSKTGFYTALVVLINLNNVTINDIFDHLNKHLQKAGSNSKGENADICAGQILTYGAILRSNLWHKISEEEQKKVLEMLLKAGKERSYLTLVVYIFLINKFIELNEDAIKKLLPIVKEEFAKPWSEQNMDSLYFLICLKNTCPNLLNKKNLSKTIGTNAIICSESIEELCRVLLSAFFGALDLKMSKLEDLQIVLSLLVKDLDSKITANNLETVLRNPITADVYHIWQKTVAVITKIEKKKKKNGLKSVFLTLFIHIGLQLFNDPKLASESLNELFVCYEKTRKGRKNSDNLSETNANIEENDDNDPLWIEVVTDLFLNLLSHNYHLLRSLIKCVFPHLCQYMTSTTIQQILSAIDPKNEDNLLSKYSGEISDDEMGEEDDNPAEIEENDSESDDDDEEPEDKVDESVNDKLRMALHQVLSSNGYQSDEESLDIDQLSDTEGEKLNKALADAFLQFKPNLGRSKKQSKDQEQLMHFRLLSAMKSGPLNLDNIRWSEIAEAIREYRSCVSFSKDAKIAFNKLCNHLRVSHIVKMKSKTVDLNNSTEDSKDGIRLIKKAQKGKKRMKSKEQLKQKKEAKEMRLKSLSEGFVNLDFKAAANISIEKNIEEVGATGVTTSKKSKRKK
ncbi:hypothetical protein NQ318_002275 [Aromia moschata]|uniref:Uncharacterized protein n=1 Tax=Aromia moschata TaxID=1265417 RepID=A0AAV8Z5H7_9CUCU|nr:hypothetical protein NQ318_002275 [Aromia moschata]